jgi:hypothetical protein
VQNLPLRLRLQVATDRTKRKPRIPRARDDSGHDRVERSLAGRIDIEVSVLQREGAAARTRTRAPPTPCRTARTGSGSATPCSHRIGDGKTRGVTGRDLRVAETAQVVRKDTFRVAKNILHALRARDAAIALLPFATRDAVGGSEVKFAGEAVKSAGALLSRPGQISRTCCVPAPVPSLHPVLRPSSSSAAEK